MAKFKLLPAKSETSTETHPIQATEKPAQSQPSLDGIDVLEDFEQFNAARKASVSDREAARNARADLETNARLTVIKMLTNVPQLEVNFTFKTLRYGGAAHVQSMRVVLSRARQAAKGTDKRLQEFKLLTVGIATEQDHDVVTVVRSQRASLKQKNVFDDIIAAMETEEEE